MTSETWKPVEGYEDRYEVSNMGNVRSLNYHMTGNTKLLKPIPSRKGYLMVGLCRDRTMKWGKVHRLVASAFIPNPENKPLVNHKDGNKSNNRADNLEWATDSENMRHAYKTGLKKGDREWGRTLGTEYGKETRDRQAKSCRKPLIATNIQTGEETTFESAAEVERLLGINHSSVSRVCTGRNKSAKGYLFRFAPKEE